MKRCTVRTIPALLSMSVVVACGGGGEEHPDTPEAPAAPIVIADAGLAVPESVLFDETADVYLVSNVNGHPLEKDGNGFISRVSPTGEILDLTWIDGAADGVTLNAPKGLAIVDDILYVTDIDVVRLFNRETGAPVGEIVLDGATFLNDLAPASDGGLYLTDTGFRMTEEGGFEPSGTDAVYHIAANGDVHTILADPGLGGPNGVVEVDGDVWVVTYGAGTMFRVADGTMADLVALPGGGLDGLLYIDGQLVVSSWGSQEVLAGAPGGEFTPVVTGAQSPADIGYDRTRNVLLIPLFELNEVRIVPLGE